MLAQISTLARERPLVLGAWLFALLMGFGLAYADIIYALRHGHGSASEGTHLGRDFVNVFTAGHLVLQGKLEIIYDLAAYREYQWMLLDGTVHNHNYSYSPVSFFYVWLFALVPYGAAYFLWIGLTGAAFLAAARPYLRGAGLPGWLALLIPAGMVNMWAGHYGFLFGAVWLAAWRLVESRPRLAGMLVGLMVVKPHLALLMPLALLRRKAWTPFVAAGLTSLSLVLASGLVFGWSYWITYVTETSAVQAAMIDETGEFFLRMMPTVFPAMMLAGLNGGLAWIVQGLCACAAMAALWKWMPQDPMQAGLATATATFLVLPYAFNYDLTVVGIAAVVALHRLDAEEPLVHHCFAVLAFLLPLLVVALNNLGVPIAPLVLAVLLGTLLRGKSRREVPASHPAAASA